MLARTIRTLIACSAVVSSTSAASAQCVDFDTPPGGSPWPCCGVVFQYNGVDFVTEPFNWFPAGGTVGGFAEPTIACSQQAGASLWLNNVNVKVDVQAFDPSGVKEITFSYMDFGGNINLTVNGSLANQNDFNGIPNNRWHPWGVDYVEASFFNGSAWVGQITLRALPGGCIDDLHIGGQELCIDDLCGHDPCDSGCTADITGPLGPPDGIVDALDFLLMIAQWGSPCVGSCEADITGPVGPPDGNVDALDFLTLISQWGGPC